MTDPEPKPRRGGRRPGSGAPRGNLNALKHGRRSRQFAQIGALLAQSPKVRETLLALAARHQVEQRSADEVAAGLLARMFERANEIAGGKLFDAKTLRALDDLADELATVGHTINRNRRPPTRRARKNRDSATHNQTADTGEPEQPEIKYTPVLD